ncbi:MAG TPA: aminotransferase class III-fold pyridoxal phosphate-dependent enzyme [Phaeodactylibacter sp.]|nr:aminotransferase class III-fold pyridoxal phosphate-dependent enzyme [Phaeodactylibacter sp.]
MDRLKQDNDKARRVGALLQRASFAENVRPVRTNILIFDVRPPYTAETFLHKLKEKGILASAFGAMTIRFVFHLDVSEDMVEQVMGVMDKM